jgi:hypothetical protein
MGRARFSATAALLGTLCGPAGVLAAQPFDFRAEAAYTYDDNVTRSEGVGNVLSDRFYTLSLNAGTSFRPTRNARVVAGVFLGGDGYDKYDGLSRYFGGIQGEIQYRTSGEFDAATFGLFLKGSRDEYNSEVRDGYRYTAGVRVLKPLSDRFDLFAAAAYNRRDGKSAVFDTDDYSARLNFDYRLTRWSTFYLGADYRKGDAVATARPSLALVTIAEAIVRDDAFTDTERIAYRFKAHAVITTLGYNVAFGERHSLDFSWRWAQVTADDEPGFGTTGRPEYKVNQYSIAYLIRF